jgi:hypothetical protein
MLHTSLCFELRLSGQSRRVRNGKRQKHRGQLLHVNVKRPACPASRAVSVTDHGPKPRKLYTSPHRLRFDRAPQATRAPASAKSPQTLACTSVGVSLRIAALRELALIPALGGSRSRRRDLSYFAGLARLRSRRLTRYPKLGKGPKPPIKARAQSHCPARRICRGT